MSGHGGKRAGAGRKNAPAVCVLPLRISAELLSAIDREARKRGHYTKQGTGKKRGRPNRSLTVRELLSEALSLPQPPAEP